MLCKPLLPDTFCLEQVVQHKIPGGAPQRHWLEGCSKRVVSPAQAQSQASSYDSDFEVVENFVIAAFSAVAVILENRRCRFFFSEGVSFYIVILSAPLDNFESRRGCFWPFHSQDQIFLLGRGLNANFGKLFFLKKIKQNTTCRKKKKQHSWFSKVATTVEKTINGEQVTRNALSPA